MTDERLDKELSLARRAVPVFGLARQQQVIWSVRRRLRGRPNTFRRLVPLVAAACLLAAAYVWFGGRAGEGAWHPATYERWELRDGSSIVLETPDTRITKLHESREEALFDLTTGAASFDVVHRPERRFRVHAGPVEVEVVGTRFRVERRGERTLVAVERGRVLVSWADTSRLLSAGDHGVYPPPPPLAALARAAADSREPAVPESDGATLHQASSTPATPGEDVVRAPSAEELFATAARARAEGLPQEAVRALRELAQRYPRDGRAPLAAFTRGRLLLENLAQPREAARAFAQARALSGAGSALAEDALAREADAWRSAGVGSEFERCAALYQKLYPRGAHLKEILRTDEQPPAR
jgi:transmembrane sensor